MSDAMTDIARDQARGALFQGFIEYLIKTIKKIRTEGLQSETVTVMMGELEEKAKETDAVGTGYFGGRTNLAQNFKDWVSGLAENDSQVWARLLASMFPRKLDFVNPRYTQLKRISPFNGKKMMLIDYGMGFVMVYVDHKRRASVDYDRLIDERGWRTRDGDTYLLCISGSKSEGFQTEIIWLGSGVFDNKGLYQASPEKIT